MSPIVDGIRIRFCEFGRFKNVIISLSRYFDVKPQELIGRGVLDAHLGIDNRLFVDPNLLERSDIPEFKGARKVLKAYFAIIIKLLEKSQRKHDLAWTEAEKRLRVREEHGAALGYSHAGGYGRAIGPDLAAVLAERGRQIIDLGITDPEIFELIGLFQEGFGPDLLSDLAVHILKDRFLLYTQRLTKRLKLKPQANFRRNGKDWLLPVAPDGRRPLVFVPYLMLSELPVALDRSEIADVARFNDEVRMSWNNIVGEARKEKRTVTKEDIRTIFLAKPKNLKDLISVYRKAAARGYDFSKDPNGLLSWEDFGRKAATNAPLVLDIKEPKDISDLRSILNAIIAQFKKNIEQNRLYEVLYKDDGTPKHEVFSQRLFYSIADAYCGANNVDLNREPNAGNGPVDFKLSKGYHARMLVEIKKSSNPDLLHGFESQLPAYEASENTSEAIYLIIRVGDSTSAIDDVLALRTKKLKAGKKVPEVVIIDARPVAAASKRGKAERRK
jgi:hypothetical protein